MTAMNEKEILDIAKTVAGECLAGRIRLLNRVVTGIYDRALRPLGIKVNQASILVIVSLSGETTPSDIGRTLRMEKSTISRNIERMRSKGWIEVGRGEDGISQLISVTPKGRELLAAVHTLWSQAQKMTSEYLGEDGVQAIHLLIGRLSSAEGKKK